MKKTLYILIALTVFGINAQTALFNSGNIQIHEQGKIGFHIDLINDGSFDENLGLAGFYGDLPINISGAFSATFYDLEIYTTNNVSLNTTLNNTNITNFDLGNFTSIRSNSNIYLNFLPDADYYDGSNISMVDGFVGINNKQDFIFPIGDGLQFRPLILKSSEENTLAKCAYFFENANNPSSLINSYSFNEKDTSIEAISSLEFWQLQSNTPSTISISWNEQSDISSFLSDISHLGLVGWHKENEQWQPIGSNAVGTLSEGFISSISFIPDDYEIITFADTFGEINDIVTTGNYIVTPNGDGINDALEIEEISLSPNNSIKIFDRYGSKVFEMDNYSNTEFTGLATSNALVISKDKGLPSGVYFYIIYLDDINLEFQGFLYLTR